MLTYALAIGNATARLRLVCSTAAFRAFCCTQNTTAIYNFHYSRRHFDETEKNRTTTKTEKLKLLQMTMEVTVASSCSRQ